MKIAIYNEKLRNCLIRYLYWIEEYINANKSEINDLEIAEEEELKKELKNLLDRD